MTLNLVRKDITNHQEETQNYCFGDRTLATFSMKLNRGATKDDWSPLHLETIRDIVKRQDEEEEKVELDLPLNHIHFDFRSGAAKVQIPKGRMWAAHFHSGRSGGFHQPILMTRRAFGHLSTLVLPKYGRGFLQELAALGDNQEGLATLALSSFVQASNKQVLVRCSRRNGHLTARSIVSDKYQIWDDLDLLNSLLNDATVAQLPVLAFERTDAGMRVQFATEKLEGPPEVNQPIQIMEAWNSEVATSSVCLKAGIWTLLCSNGMAGFEQELRRSWYHSGRVNRIRDGIPAAIEAMKVKTAGVLDQYNSSLNVAIDDAIKFMENELADLSKIQLRQTMHAYHDSRTNAAKPGTLGRVVNAVTRAAQEQELYGREAMEHRAANIMNRGLIRAVGGRLKAN